VEIEGVVGVSLRQLKSVHRVVKNIITRAFRKEATIVVLICLCWQKTPKFPGCFGLGRGGLCFCFWFTALHNWLGVRAFARGGTETKFWPEIDPDSSINRLCGAKAKGDTACPMANGKEGWRE